MDTLQTKTEAETAHFISLLYCKVVKTNKGKKGVQITRNQLSKFIGAQYLAWSIDYINAVRRELNDLKEISTDGKLVKHSRLFLLTQNENLFIITRRRAALNKADIIVANEEVVEPIANKLY